VTVDHALRPGSAAEAGRVGETCRRLGIRHAVARWTETKPASGLAAAAREARYRLLCNAAADAGSRLLLAGHTADDQAETVAMRAARGEGRGLAGMAPATLLDGRVWLARPLLAVRREALRDWLRGARLDWVDDPTNEDDRYERVRTRRQLADEAAFAAAIATAGRAAGERIAAGRRAAALIKAAARRPAPGLIRIDGNRFEAADRPTAIYALRLLLAAMGGRSQLPDEARSAGLLDRLAEPALRASLSRVTVDRRRDAVYLHRELRFLPEPAALVDDGPWDGRYRIVGAPGATVGPLGRDGASPCAGGPADAPPALVAAAAATLPAGGPSAATRVALDARESAGRPAAHPVVGPFARWLSCFDLAPARALASLVGGELPPPSPYAGHDAAGP
jgi:tRNA(Ile)-lysidine synthase